ncbi:guanine deaminase [Agrobacterium rhizogenes]|uniref:Guanine deaminase n=1 Tax=Rhizobium rhizogenes NBRC 13257 TaxID=1220581 RepID=A0AA87Q663_RHIRH|nr:guanine deaminase [Rhizobium rhizogenes]OCJ02078.1 guanine deaminase [Agrobacterium sp. 13-626]KEA09167.1 chlorohydrolase [Rhizobium rhizogenes]MDJ1636509.1 guanine deaminase [Rhizobium rhizogenes]MQB31083.1 guanine deaminase [Rhizobium rhizogenes]NTF58438.1 guanine deaminase [Rhizobium rhizogenes]
MDLRGKTLSASGFHSPERGTIDVLDDVLIEIDADGAITAVHRYGDPNYRTIRDAREASGELVTLPAGSYILPGFVDLHVHAPQYPQLGDALDVPLEVWLQKYTFPLEARYQDAAFARQVYGLLVEDLLANGTTTALYFATIHQEATRVLVDTCLEKGQRALIGKVAMDNAEECPDYYRDLSPEEAVDGTRALIDYVRGHPDNHEGRVLPVVTPRFIPSCTNATLEGLGAIAKECGCHVQTHCSESDWAHGYVLARHGMTDTDSLDRFGLLGRKTVLAHANFLTAKDMETVKAREAAIAHCPLSNAYFANAVFPLRAALEKGLHVGLGTDISGGPSASMLENARGAILVSRMLQSGVDPNLPPAARSTFGPAQIDFRDAFYITTSGGGIALDLPVGQFAPGYQFDAVLIDTEADKGTVRLFEDRDQGEGILQKIIYTASKPNLAATWVGGRKV